MDKKTMLLHFLVAAILSCLTGNVAAQHLIPMPREMHIDTIRRVSVTMVDAKIDASLRLPDEGYTLRIGGKKAVLRARDNRGLVWAHATLR